MSGNETTTSTIIPSHEEDDDLVAVVLPTTQIDFSESQYQIMTLAPRFAAVISLACAIYMATLAWASRKRLYHRLMFCLSLHLILFSLSSIYGTTAMPEDTPHVWKPRGTIQTCSLQGFALQVSMGAPLYYVCLSIYSFLAVRHNFEVSKYSWVEKWIHVGVHIFPVGSAIYLLLVDAFNPGISVCWIESIPFGCGAGTDVPCSRGPQNIFLVATVLAFLPVAFCLVVPTCVMVALYRETKRRQAAIQMEASTVAKQACLYLCALYWSYMFAIVNGFIWWYKDEPLFLPTLLAAVTLNLLGVWILGIYLYFRVVPPSPSPALHRMRRRKATPAANKSSVTTTQAALEPVLEQELPTNDNSAAATTASMTSTHRPEQASSSSQVSSRQPSSELQRSSYSFNIFDGTNASGDYADFVFEGDSEEEREDMRESRRWHDIQEYL